MKKATLGFRIYELYFHNLHINWDCKGYVISLELLMRQEVRNLDRNKRFILNLMPQQNTSKFAILKTLKFFKKTTTPNNLIYMRRRRFAFQSPNMQLKVWVIFLIWRCKAVYLLRWKIVILQKKTFMTWHAIQFYNFKSLQIRYF